MINDMIVNFLMKSIVLWIIIPVMSFYQHKIYLSENLQIAKCQQINHTTYRCSSITELFQQLSSCCNSTDIFIEPGNYSMAQSYTLVDLHDIRIRSEANAVIHCAANVNGTYDFDTGIAFVRVRNLVVTNISIIGCGMKHVTTNHIEAESFIVVRSALFILNSTNISLDNITITRSNGIGLLIYDTNGSVKIIKSSFINNRLNLLQQNNSFAGGGGVYIEFTECTPGVINCDSISNRFNKKAQYTVDHCIFTGNHAFYNVSIPEEFSSFITFGVGGGLALWLYGHAQNNSFLITSTFFGSNSALYGGGLCVHSRQDTRYNSVRVLWSHFEGNFGELGGGGLIIGYAILQFGGESLFNTYIVANCTFEQNQARIGGGMNSFGSLEPNKTKPTNRFEVHNCSFINNGAQYGSAIQINEDFFDAVLIGTRFTLILINCTFTSNNFYAKNSTSSVGTVALSRVDVEFRETTIFSNNNSTALLIDGATARFSNNSVTTFQDNSGLRGGAISLITGASIRVYPDTTLTFIRNKAVQSGGAIYVELSTPYDYLLSRACFVRYYVEKITPSEWQTNFTFINNSGGNNSDTIFVNTLNPCVDSTRVRTNFLYNDPFYYDSYTTDSVISTSPAIFKFLNPEGSILTAIPGEIFDLPVQLIDELGQNVSSAIFIATCESSSPHVVPPYHFTNGSIQIAGKPGKICMLKLITDTNYEVSTTVTIPIILLNCPPGVVYNSDKMTCECMVDQTNQNPAITGCKSTSFQAYFDRLYWIGYASDNTVDLLISPCPFRYCYKKYTSQGQLLPREANKTTLDTFVCGNRSRTGLLCGQCIEGYSVALNSPTFTCDKCMTPLLGILYLFLLYVIPVTVLFYIIMAYNIRMTTGPIGALLFFSQLISSQNRFVFDYSEKTDTDEALAASNIVTMIYSVSNLEFFQHDVFSYCLFPNAGTVDILAFNLLLSFYPILLVFTYFLIRRHCTYKLKCFQKFRFSSKSVTHGMCAFLVLCFARINILVFSTYIKIC